MEYLLGPEIIELIRPGIEIINIRDVREEPRVIVPDLYRVARQYPEPGILTRALYPDISVTVMVTVKFDRRPERRTRHVRIRPVMDLVP